MKQAGQCIQCRFGAAAVLPQGKFPIHLMGLLRSVPLILVVQIQAALDCHKLEWGLDSAQVSSSSPPLAPPWLPIHKLTSCPQFSHPETSCLPPPCPCLDSCSGQHNLRSSVSMALRGGRCESLALACHWVSRTKALYNTFTKHLVQCKGIEVGKLSGLQL